MEPQLFSCGLTNSKTGLNTLTKLQWSRNFSVADCGIRTFNNERDLRGFNGAATFQLRIDGIGFREFKVLIASMEPQLFSCGLKTGNCIALQPTLSLQWSRNFSVADWYYDADDVNLTWFMLQWSRNFSVADCSKCVCWKCFRTCFNGAATFQLRIEETSVLEFVKLGVASMEPQLFSCGLQETE